MTHKGGSFPKTPLFNRELWSDQLAVTSGRTKVVRVGEDSPLLVFLYITEWCSNRARPGEELIPSCLDRLQVIPRQTKQFTKKVFQELIFQKVYLKVRLHRMINKAHTTNKSSISDFTS